MGSVFLGVHIFHICLSKDQRRWETGINLSYLEAKGQSALRGNYGSVLTEIQVAFFIV